MSFIQPTPPARPMRRRKTIAEHGPDPVDIYVGHRLRQRRTLLGISQGKLADAFGVSFQQVQKYERGTNRISASRLHLLTKILDVPVGYFFEGLPNHLENREELENVEIGTPDRMTSRETLELVRAYYRITDPDIRRRLADLIRAVGRPEADPAAPDGKAPADDPDLTHADGVSVH